ncbi:hypothetical protein K3175_07815 [Qipengyuania sp. GH1]|uniref:hypothetical protein n=1 Tax=Qipengyuania aestuarii TaxID=2867241 RepID=UPI001C889486|nr:hypothetical protein [Qipengyuania aestuarii]MBX7535564.1 hypothetical protein [Qipengyuania aestuarii]
MDDTSSLLADPEWLAHRYDEKDDSFRFIRVARRDHRKATFLTDEHLARAEEYVAIPRNRIDGSLFSRAPIHFIFHSAYCCSTLAARMFDLEGVAMGLKEPVLLNDMVGYRRRGADVQKLAQVLDLSLSLLARPFGHDQNVVVKPSSIANVIGPAILGMRPQARALFLYAPIEHFLASIAVKGLWGRQWARTSLIGQAKDQALSHRFTTEELLELTDLQVAGLGWLSHLAIFSRMQRKLGSDRVAFCDSATLLKNPLRTTEAFFGHLGISLEREQAEAIATGTAFTRNSKDRLPYSADKRQTQLDRTTESNREEIEMVAEWVRKLALEAGLDASPDSSLDLI